MKQSNLSSIKLRENEYVQKFLEILFGLFLSAIFYYRQAGAALSFTIGFSMTVLIEVLRLSYQITKLKETYDELIQGITKYQIEPSRMMLISDYGYNEISAAGMSKIWLDLLLSVKESYYATNYISLKDIYVNMWANNAREIQATKIKFNDVAVKKVFIIDSKNDLTLYEAEMSKQTDAKISVKYIYKDKCHEKYEHYEGLESYDFGIFDQQVLLIWKLDKERKIIGGKLLFDKKTLEMYNDFFKYLRESGQEWEINHQ